MPPRPPVGSIERVRGPLAESLVTLAGMPDDVPEIDDQLVTIARLAADLVAPVSYASVTAMRENAYTTVAATSELAIAVDKAQYADQSGPCLSSLDDGTPIAVPDIAATMKWPGFRDAAFQLGLRASVSVPLFAGSGVPVAVLNLYSHEAGPMAQLSGRVMTAYDSEHGDRGDPDGAGWDAGSHDLIAGLHEAFAVRTCIQQAIGIIIQRERCTPDSAYLILRTRAAETGESLLSIAESLVRPAER
jgi:hypothetical protein